MKNDRSCPPVRRIATFTLAVSLLFLAFFDLSKHLPFFQDINVFAVDPFDAIGSFSVQIAVFCAALSFLRSFSSAKMTSGENPDLALSLRASSLAMLSIALTSYTDWIALVRLPHVWIAHVGGAILLLSALVFFILAIMTMRGIRRYRKPSPSDPFKWKTAVVALALFLLLFLYPDLSYWGESGSLINIVVGIGVLLLPMVLLKKYFITIPISDPDDLFDVFLRILPNRWRLRMERTDGVVIRRRLIWIVLAFAILMGLLLMSLEVIKEGAPTAKLALKVMGIYVGFEATVILLCFFLFNRFLGLLKFYRK